MLKKIRYIIIKKKKKSQLRTQLKRRRDNSREGTRGKRELSRRRNGGETFIRGIRVISFKVHICVSRNQCGCLHANSSPAVLPLGHNYPEYMRPPSASCRASRPALPPPPIPCHITRKPRRRPSRNP